MMARKLDLLAAALFILGLAAIVFLAGFYSGKNRGPFYDPLKQAEETARGVWNAYFDKLDFIITDRVATPVQTTARVLDAARMAPGVTLIGAYTAEGFAAWLVDEQGKELHRWHARFSEVFPQARHIKWQARDQAIGWQGMHLFPNGDLLFNFQDANFPFGSGLVKLDRDSKLVWKLDRNTHHDVAVEPDGTIWVPSQHYRPDGLPGFAHLKPWYYEDTVLELAPDGTVRDEFPVLGALKSDQGLLTITYAQGLNIDQPDPIHLNSVMPLPAAWAERFPGLAAGDLLVSLRNLNMLAVLDRQSRKVKRVIAGPFIRQHDAEFLPNGHIMLYDNSGGDPACGGTRVIELDPNDLSVVWQYGGCGEGQGGLDSFVRGMQQVLDNGNVLLVEPLGGRALEVTRAPVPELVWEYVNVIGTEDGKPVRGLINHAERFTREALTFLPPG